MVFFTCNRCGESVKKPSVEKHYNTKCRGAIKNVSCMDCLKDFHGEEYVAHTKCITEAQKYSGKNYVQKESKNSNAKKQESWMDIIRSILDSSDYKLSEQARSAFQRLQSVDNVPRKKAKFQNFVKNCMHMPVRLAEEVWSVLEKELEKMKLAKQQDIAAKAEEKPNENGIKREAAEVNGQEEPAKKKSKKEKKAENGKIGANENIEPAKQKTKKNKAVVDEVAGETNGSYEPAKKKAKKQKAEAEEVAVAVVEESAVDTAKGVENFEWRAVLEKIVRKNAEGIVLEKLKKRVLKKYAANLSAEELTEKQQKKFEKKFAKNLKKSEVVQLEGDIVKVC